MSEQLYKFFCQDDREVIRVWGSAVPTECPNNSNHSIVGVRIDNEFEGKVKSEENSDGYFETTHFVINIPSGSPGAVSSNDVSWPMDVLLWRTLITPTSDMVGDTISVIASPETTIGVLTAPVIIGQTTFNVNSTVTANMWRGFLVNLYDGVNNNFLGRCTNVNVGAGTITVETGPENNFAAGSPVKIGVFVLKDIFIADTATIDIGIKGIKGKTVTANTILRILYTNNSGTVKTMRWRPEYYNNG